MGLAMAGLNDVVSEENQDIEPGPSNIGPINKKYFQWVVKKKQLIGILKLDEMVKE